jgi:predicted O-methyltransferase YrrM
LNLAFDLVRQALHLFVLAVHSLTSRFLHLASAFLDATFDLIFIDTHVSSPA